MNIEGKCINCKNLSNQCSCVGEQQQKSRLCLRGSIKAEASNFYARQKLMKMNLEINEDLQKLRMQLIEYKSAGIKMNLVDFSELIRAKFSLNLPKTIKQYFYTSTKTLYSITEVDKTEKIVSTCPDGMNCNLFSTVISSETHVFIAGGYNDQYVCSDEIIFCDLKTLQWGRLREKMSQGRTFAAGLYCQGCIYILGGTNNEGNGLNDMDIINLKTEKVINVKLQDSIHKRPSACLSENQIMVISSDHLPTVTVYDLNGGYVRHIKLDDYLSVYMIAYVETVLLIFSNDNCYYFKRNNKKIKIKGLQKQWTQHTITFFDNNLHFRDYASGSITRIPIDFN